MTKINKNGVLMDMTPQEETEFAQTLVDGTAQKEAEVAAKTAADANIVSGKAKLKAGEALNDAELSALFGD